MNKLITLDGYEFTHVYSVDTDINKMHVYRVNQVVDHTNQPPIYILTSGEYREWYITNHNLDDVRKNIYPQFYDAVFEDELTATIMAQNVALRSIIESQKAQLEDAEKVIHELQEKTTKVLNSASFKNCSIIDRFYDSQMEKIKELRNKEKEN